MVSSTFLDFDRVGDGGTVSLGEDGIPPGLSCSPVRTALSEKRNNNKGNLSMHQVAFNIDDDKVFILGEREGVPEDEGEA